MAFLDPVLNPILGPLINYNPFLGIIVMALAISFLISLVYKFMTNQEKMKALKQEQKEFQKRMKELRSEPEKMMALQKEAMRKNMEYMKMSLKPTLVTMIPIILIFGWMAGSLAYEPIFPGETYSITATFAEDIVGDAELILDEGSSLLTGASSVQTIEDGQASWSIKSEDGLHDLEVVIGDTSQTKSVLITTDLETEPAVEMYTHSDIEQIQINYNKLKPAGKFSFPVIGWVPGWLGWYILFSLVFSISIRKAMGLY